MQEIQSEVTFIMTIVKRCKCVIIGDAGVGKTAIVKNLLGPPHIFPKKYTMTPGVEITSKSIRSTVNSNVILEYFIYDFSGQKMYYDLIRKLWSTNVTVIVGVFDVNREETFYTLTSMLTELIKSINNSSQLVGVILGNKCDSTNRRIVTVDDGHQLAKKYQMRYYDVSAKESKGSIENAFLYLTSVWLDQKMFKLLPNSSNDDNDENKINNHHQQQQQQQPVTHNSSSSSGRHFTSSNSMPSKGSFASTQPVVSN